MRSLSCIRQMALVNGDCFSRIRDGSLSPCIRDGPVLSVYGRHLTVPPIEGTDWFFLYTGRTASSYIHVGLPFSVKGGYHPSLYTPLPVLSVHGRHRFSLYKGLLLPVYMWDHLFYKRWLPAFLLYTGGTSSLCIHQ